MRKMCTTVIRHATIPEGLLPGLPSTAGWVKGFEAEKVNTRIKALEQSRKVATEVNSLGKDLKLAMDKA